MNLSKTLCSVDVCPWVSVCCTSSISLASRAQKCQLLETVVRETVLVLKQICPMFNVFVFMVSIDDGGISAMYRGEFVQFSDNAMLLTEHTMWS